MSAPPTIPRTVVVTGHFPPAPGGVQTFTWEIVRRLPPDRLVVVAPERAGARRFDAGLDFPVVRVPSYRLAAGLPGVVRGHHATAAWLTAMAPLALYAPLVRAAGIDRIVASTHGQELGWARFWPSRRALRGMARAVDVVTYLSDTTRAGLVAAGLSPRTAYPLAGGVDPDWFRPEPRRAAGRPTVLSVARLVRRKGHDVLLDAWHDVRAMHPDARLVLVGDGPLRAALTERAAREHPGSVVVAGSVSPGELPGWYAHADVFVLPCRDIQRGLQTEGLGLATLEASASGLPVVVGRSGGSVASVRDGVSGHLVDATRPGPIAAALCELLADPERARSMGAAGRAWVAEEFSWDGAAERLAALLCGDPVRASAPA